MDPESTVDEYSEKWTTAASSAARKRDNTTDPTEEEMSWLSYKNHRIIVVKWIIGTSREEVLKKPIHHPDMTEQSHWLKGDVITHHKSQPVGINQLCS